MSDRELSQAMNQFTNTKRRINQSHPPAGDVVRDEGSGDDPGDLSFFSFDPSVRGGIPTIPYSPLL